MQLLQSWKDSLSLLKPSNLKLFCLVTLKLLISTYKTLLVYFWWFGLLLGVSYYVNIIPNITNFYLLIPWYIKRVLIIFVVLLTARPSIGIKDYTYFMNYWRHFIYALFFYCVIAPAIAVTDFFLLNFVFFGSGMGPQEPGQAIFVGLFTLPIVGFIFACLMMISLFMVLFLLDSDGTLKSALSSLWRGTKMFWYNLPFCLIFMGVRYLVVFSFLSLLPIVYSSVVIDFLFPVSLCFITNFYVKKLHEQFTVYFKSVKNGDQ